MYSARQPHVSIGAPPESFARRVRHPIRSALEGIGTHVVYHARRTHTIRDPGKRAHLDDVVDAFHRGYLCACRQPDTGDLVDHLSRLSAHHQGFAYEGAAMALVLLDGLPPWRASLFSALLATAERHRYLLHAGAGWAFARVGRVEGRRFGRLDPLLRWLAVDASGFHDGFLRGMPSAAATTRRATLSRYGARAYDQGVGRSLWFTTEADPSAIAAAIEMETPGRQPDLWSGVGLACAYAGGLRHDEVAALAAASGPLRVHLAQGVAFAAEAHESAAGCVPRHTEEASRLICGTSAAHAAQVAREAAVGAVPENGLPAYEIWRMRIRSCMERHSG